MRIGVQQPGPGRPENRNRVNRIPARFRCSCDPESMIWDSGVPSIHSVMSTWSVAWTTDGT